MKGIGTTAVHQAYRVGLLERGIAPVMAVFVLHFASTTAAQEAAVNVLPPALFPVSWFDAGRAGSVNGAGGHARRLRLGRRACRQMPMKNAARIMFAHAHHHHHLMGGL